MNETTLARQPNAARAKRQFFCVVCLATAIGLLTGGLPAQETATGTVQLYFFTNPGCAPCRQVEPGIEALSREGYPVTTVYLNQQPQLATQFNVTRTPTVILVANRRIVGRHAGLIDGVTLKQWFAAVGVPAGNVFANQQGGTKEPLESPAATEIPSRAVSQPANRLVDASTIHQGTRQPAGELEARALNSTVRLKVEDPEGISYATGTVIHRHNGECLVITCGHVFRDANGKGEITAEFGFENGNLQTAPGQMISYDAQARDIGLVAIQTQHPFQPVPIAAASENVVRGLKIFSIGCDHGESPTIRRSQIKNRATYDGSIKYDIFGRPVDGRSGGGLFNEQGQLIGICNAAAVEQDEGIYTALETIHWLITQVNLTHLFDQRSSVADNLGNPVTPVTMPVDGASRQTIAGASPGLARINPEQGPERGNRPANRGVNPAALNQVSWDDQSAGRNSDSSAMEVIIIVRSKTDPARAQAITVSHPSPQLLSYLDSMQDSSSEQRQIDVAQLRKRIEYGDVNPMAR